MGLQLNSDISMRIYSVASIAENPLLSAAGLSNEKPNWKTCSCPFSGITVILEKKGFA